MKKILLPIMAFALLQPVFAGQDHDMPKVMMPAGFDTLKQLVGTWHGKTDIGEGKQDMQVIYKLTSGGTAITETLMPGTPHEMESVYYREGKSLGMTHYCALGNHPRMTLKQANDQSLAFEMTKPAGVGSMNEPHMHALTLTLIDKDTLQQDWVHYADGKATKTVTFVLNRSQ